MISNGKNYFLDIYPAFEWEGSKQLKVIIIEHRNKINMIGRDNDHSMYSQYLWNM